MAYWIRIDEHNLGVWADLTTGDPTGRFAPTLNWVVVPDGLATDALARQSGLSVAADGVTVQIANVAAYAAAAVVAMQVAFNTALTAGITVPNVPAAGANLPVATDFNSLTLVHGAYTAASAGLFATTPWQTPTGFVTLTAAQVITVGQAVLTFEQGCFGRLQTVTAAIETALASSPDPATQIAAIAAAAVWPTS